MPSSSPSSARAHATWLDCEQLTAQWREIELAPQAERPRKFANWPWLRQRLQNVAMRVIPEHQPNRGTVLDDIKSAALLRLMSRVDALSERYQETSEGRPIVGFMSQVVLTEVRDLFAAYQRQQGRHLTNGDPRYWASPKVEEDDTAELLKELVATVPMLPNPTRTAIEHQLAGISVAESAAELGVSQDRVKQLRQNGVRRLRSLMV